MRITSMSDLKAHFSEYADRAEHEHERYLVTRNGRPSVVLVSADEWESMEETLFWLSQPGILEQVDEARADLEAGRTFDETGVREALGLSPRGS